jgi:hypothetical protein
MKKMFFLGLTLIVMSAVSANAQVLIGGNGTTDEPHAGAILDLSKTIGKGLLLPKVDLQGLDVFTVAGQEEGASGAGMLVYNTAETWGEPGVYVWDGTKWSKAGASVVTPPCNLPTISLPAADQIILSYGETTRRLAVTANGDNLSYQWESSSTGAIDSWTLIAGAENAAYNAPTTTIGVLYYHCIVSNECGNVTSPKFTVNVSASFPENGNYHLIGTRCYDIALSGTNLGDRTNDFDDSFVKPYSFKYENSFTNLSYSVSNDPSSIISSLPVPATTSGTGTGTIAFNVTFSSNVRTIVGVGGSATARIVAYYTDNAGADKVAYVDVKVQDNVCCDGTVLIGAAFDYALGYTDFYGSSAGDGAKAGGATINNALSWAPEFDWASNTPLTSLAPYFVAAGADLCLYKAHGNNTTPTHWDLAVNNCANGSYADGDPNGGWYLPNAREWVAVIAALGNKYNATLSFTKDLVPPNYNTTVFGDDPQTIAPTWYWSSTISSDTSKGWAPLFSSAVTSLSYRTFDYYIRCVRRI